MEDPVFAFPTRRPAQPDLKSAMRKARIEEAERSSAVAELRGAELGRLELLKEELAPVFAQLPADADMFDFGLVSAEKPRLFVDMVAFVEMGRDRRTFRLIQDTRSGRMVLAESDRIDPMVDAVTAYLGRRLVERERALAGEIVAPLQVAPPPSADRAEAPRGARAYRFGDLVFAFLLGVILGMTLLLLAAWWKARGGFAWLALAGVG
ncbi:hypothetical protein SLNSH_00280 [Alsobacter soli]|uniref:Uncharacterized protein n=1 Tax=Alsobacter soli TaxID=2109933 RepID=A0A2T1HZ44_9HYPH|nr:hypothetical protein [Alsobacter soli]PSC06860.1 hypothetical protein SLNSH_00280 [Alsobacter soli]